LRASDLPEPEGSLALSQQHPGHVLCPARTDSALPPRSQGGGAPWPRRDVRGRAAPPAPRHQRGPHLGDVPRSAGPGRVRLRAADVIARLRALALVVIGAVGWGSVASAACTPSSLPLDTPMALVMSGGGAKGAYEAGVAATLMRRGLPIRLAAGSSAGALNAAMVADGRAERLQARWRDLTREQVYSLRASIFFAGLLPGWLTLWALDSAGSLFDPQPLRAMITASLDLGRIRA